MKPISLSWPLKANKTASHRKVASVSPSADMSETVRTFVMSRRPKPKKATLVTLRCRASAKTQLSTMNAKAPEVIHSSRVSGPSVPSSLRAATGASGVAPTPGGNMLAITRGSNKIAIRAGTDDIISHLPNPISTPNCCATWMPMGLADVAVIQRADETARLAIPQNIR